VLTDAGTPTIENTIVAYSMQGMAVTVSSSSVSLSCCDLYGNFGGDWVGPIANQYGTDGNISEDPLFCDPEAGDFTLHGDSPCAPCSPPNPECGLIGAWPVGCGPTPTLETTWGAIKMLYR
jgi:hypothetical protein